MAPEPTSQPARQRVAILLSAVPALLLSAQFAYVLLAPLSGNNRQWAVDAVLLLLMEFFLVHAGFLSMGLMAGERRARLGLAAALGAFYLLFIALFAFLFGAPAMAAIAGVLLAGRLGGAALAEKQDMGARVATSVFGVVAYMGAVIGTAAPEAFPSFGFTTKVLAELRPAFGSTSGLWVEQPHRAVAGAALYFLVLGIFELARLRKARRGSAIA